MASKKYQYGGRYKPEGGVTPIDERKDIQAAEDMRQTSVANMHKHVTSGGRRPSGVSARDTSGVLGAYTGAGAGSAVAKGLQNIGDDITRGVVGAARHFPGYHSAVGDIASNFATKLNIVGRDYNYMVRQYDLTTQPGGGMQGIGFEKARKGLKKASRELTDLLRQGGVTGRNWDSPLEGFRQGRRGRIILDEELRDKARHKLVSEASEKVGKEVVEAGIKRGVGRAIGYATGIGAAVDIGLAAKWAWDYNRDNPGALAGHKEALHRKNLKAGSPGKWGVDI
tara:strand:- start:9720 stop:10565 length:846 start_codon:yes stop_codon:yes gene_type:complete